MGPYVPEIHYVLTDKPQVSASLKRSGKRRPGRLRVSGDKRWAQTSGGGCVAAQTGCAALVISITRAVFSLRARLLWEHRESFFVL